MISYRGKDQARQHDRSYFVFSNHMQKEEEPRVPENEDEHLDLVKRMEEKGPLDKYVIASACGRGHMKVVEYLRSKGVPWGNHCTSFAAAAGRLEVVQYLRTQGLDWHWRDMSSAVGSKNKELIMWMLLEGRRLSSVHLEVAYMKGDINFVKWLLDQGCPCDGDRSVLLGVVSGDLDLVMSLHNHGASFAENEMGSAAGGGLWRCQMNRGFLSSSSSCIFRTNNCYDIPKSNRIDYLNGSI